MSRSNKVFTKFEKLAILDHQGWLCFYCRRPLKHEALGTNAIHFDHFIPYSLGGPSSKENMMQAACAECNIIKTNHLFTSNNDARLYIRGRLSLPPYDQADLQMTAAQNESIINELDAREARVKAANLLLDKMFGKKSE